MKRAILIFLQFIVFLVVFFVGSILPGIPSTGVPMWAVTLSSGHTFVYTGLVFVTLLFVLIYLIEAVTRRARTAGVPTTIAYALAVLLGLLMKFGFKSLG